MVLLAAQAEAPPHILPRDTLRMTAGSQTQKEVREMTTADNREGKMTTHTHGWRYAGTRGTAYYSRCQCGKWRHESVWATRPDIDEVLDGPPYGADSLNPRDGLGHVGIAVD